MKQPGSSSRLDQDQAIYAVLLCAGWWDTLTWQYYSQSRGYTGNIETATGGINQAWGNLAAQSQAEQRITITGSAAWQARYAWLKLYRVGAPADNVICELLTAPTSGLVASQTVAGSTISRDSASWYVFDFGAGASLTPGTNYYLRLRRSGAADAVNFYGLKVEEDALLGASQFYLWNGAAWVARVPSASAILGLFGFEVITSQIVTIGVAAQFITGVRLQTSSTVQAKLFRSGKLRIQEELLDLAASGYSTGEGLRLWVDAGRQLVVDVRPAITQVELRVNPLGEVRHASGRRLIGGELPVGKWAYIDGLAIIGGTVGAPAAVYVDRAEWKNGRWIVKWSDTPGAR